MAGGENRKIRLVKCPKCMRLLPELADVPVYECGGCGTILQAKIRRNDLENTKLVLPQTESVQSPSELEQVSEDKGSTSASQNENFLQVQNGSQREDLNIHKQVSSLVKTDFHDNEDLPGVDENGTNSSERENLTSEELHDTSIRRPETTTDDQLDQSLTPVVHGIDRIRPRENLVTTDLIETSSELRDAFNDMPAKSPTNRYAHANGGSVSSFDGTDEQVPDHNLHLYSSNIHAQKFKGAHQGSFEKGKMGIDLEMQSQLKHSLSSDTSYYSMQYSRRGDRMRLNEDESPMVPFYHRASIAGFDSGSPSPSCHWHDEFQCSSSFCSPDVNLQYHEQERMKLLRMVYELQNQLEGTHMSRGHAYHPKASRHETRAEQNWAHQSRFSRTPFSREFPNYRRQQDDHVYNDPYNKEIYGANNSSSSTPQRRINPEVPTRYMDSPFSLQSRDSRFDDKKQKDQHLAKRHFRPMAGGAPFITCYHCLKPLQLPADFLLFEKKCHRLRCGACEKVLKFSLRNSTQILPYAPSSSETDKNMSFECVEERKMKMSLFKPSMNRYKNHPMKSESVGTSSKSFYKEKRSSAVEQLGPKRGPALHSLMGYNSPSQVMRGSGERQS